MLTFFFTDSLIPPNAVNITLGQFLSNSRKDYIPSLSFFGMMKDFYVWNQFISDEEVNSYVTCQMSANLIEDSIVKWNPKLLNLKDSTTLVNVEIEKVCRPLYSYVVQLSPPLLYPVAKSICKTLRGEFIVDGELSSSFYKQPKLLALHSNSESPNLIDLEEKDLGILHKRSSIPSKNVKHFSADYSFEKRGSSNIQYFSNRRSKSIKNDKLMDNVIMSPLLKKATPKVINTSPLPMITKLPSPIDEDVEVFEIYPSIIETDLNLNSSANDTYSTEEPYPEKNPEEVDFIAYCKFLEPPVFRVSGFCTDLTDIVEEKYIVLGRRNEGEIPLIQGFAGTEINFFKGMWVANSKFK